MISIVDQVKKKGDYHLQVSDIQAWEKEHGRIPEGSVVMVRSDWSKKWTTDAEARPRSWPPTRSSRASR